MLPIELGLLRFNLCTEPGQVGILSSIYSNVVITYNVSNQAGNAHLVSYSWYNENQ